MLWSASSTGLRDHEIVVPHLGSLSSPTHGGWIPAFTARLLTRSASGTENVRRSAGADSQNAGPGCVDEHIPEAIWLICPSKHGCFVNRNARENLGVGSPVTGQFDPLS